MNSKIYNQYQVITLTKDLNPVIKRGMKGVILENYGDDKFEIECVRPDGTNYEYNGQFTFTVDQSYFD